MAVKLLRSFNFTLSASGNDDFSQQRCWACGERAQGKAGLCVNCLADLPLVTNPCTGCGAPLAVPGTRCAECLRRPRSFDACLAPYAYAAPVDVLVRRMKFKGDLLAARWLGRLLANRIGPARAEADCLVPVPLHTGRLLRRGFNQSVELAGELAALCGLPILRSWAAFSSRSACASN